VGGLTMPVDTGDQVVCTVGQTDGHSSPDHTMCRADIQCMHCKNRGALTTLRCQNLGCHSYTQVLWRHFSARITLGCHKFCVMITPQCLWCAIVTPHRVSVGVIITSQCLKCAIVTLHTNIRVSVGAMITPKVHI